jgi:hydrogenase maturation protease
MAGPSIPCRVLCLGNELLADDALGSVVAGQLSGNGLEVVYTTEAGVNLLDYILGAARLIVVDTILTGAAAPGSIHILREGDMETVSGAPLHYLGLFDTLRLARELALPVPEDVVIVAVEAADCITIGGEMTPVVQAAIPRVIDCVGRL